MSTVKIRTEYKFIVFRENPSIGVWNFFNKRSGYELGVVEYFRHWKQYVVQFVPDAIFSKQYLLDIADFIRQLNEL